MVSTRIKTMTYTEYCNQTEVVYMPNVVLGKGDCKVSYLGKRGDGKKLYEVSIDYKGTRIYYSLVPMDGNCLKVSNEYSSNGSASCFHLDVEEFPEVFDEDNQILR